MLNLKLKTIKFKFQKQVKDFKEKSIGEFNNVWGGLNCDILGDVFTYILTNIPKIDKKKNKLWRITKNKLQNKNYNYKNYEIWD